MPANLNIIKFFVTVLLFFQFWQISAQSLNKQGYLLPFDTVVNYLEKKYPVKLYFEPEWFKNKRFHSSVLNLSFDEIISFMKNAGNCSVITIDSSLIVFVHSEAIDTSLTVKSNEDFIIIGNPYEYGKYSRATIKGKVVDGKTGEPLPGAGVFVEETKTSVVTDRNGKFIITLPVNEYNIKFSFVGYENNISKVKLFSTGSATFEIMEKSINLNEVIITAERSDDNVLGTQMGMLQLDRKGIRELPVSFGEIDIIKSLTLLPGIQTVGEFGTGLNVRGGSADQNLILIDDVPVFNSSHLFGLTSILNPDVVTGVTMLKGDLPAKYGERASSLLDIRTGDSNLEKASLKGGIGLINSRLTLELPMEKDIANLVIGGRTNYSNWLLHSLRDIDLRNSSANFHDLNVALTITPNKNNKVTLFIYDSKDKVAFNTNTSYQYKSTLASTRWNWIINKKLSNSLMVGLSRYEYNELDTLRPTDSYEIKSHIYYNTLKWNLNWFPNDNHSIDFGFNGMIYSVMPGNLLPYLRRSQVMPILVPEEKANEFAGYISDHISISPKFSTDVGIRYSWYALKGPSSVYIYQSGLPKSLNSIIDTVDYGKNNIIKQYWGLEPRISVRYSINDSSSVKFSYTRLNQYINMASNTAVMIPSDVWKLSDTYIRPLRCDQYAIGYFRNFYQNAIEMSIEFYYKTLQNIIDYKNGAQILLNQHIETDLINAEGYNYGAELYIRKNKGRLSGWISYTYSRSMRKTKGTFDSEQVNDNRYFPSDYDRPHNLVFNTNYHLSRRWRFAASFTFSTGRPVTLPEIKYIFNPGLDSYYNNNTVLYYSDRNKYRLPAYHRLDVSITLGGSLRHKTKWKSSWTLSIINLYGRRNTYSIYYKRNVSATDLTGSYKPYSLYEFCIIGCPFPTLTYNFTF